MFEIFKTGKYLSCFKTVKNIFINLIDIMAKIDENKQFFSTITLKTPFHNIFFLPSLCSIFSIARNLIKFKVFCI